MESKGTLKDVSMDWKTGRMRLTFELESDVSSLIDKIKDKPLRIIAKQWREKRSLDANAYYWVLLSRLAEVAGISKPRAHNLMLRRYGQNLMIAGQMAYLVVPDTTEAEETALEAETFHIRPTSQVKQGKDGKAWIKLPDCGTCSVIWSENEDGMEHVSVSPKKKFRVPTWDDMCVLKDVFFEDEEEAYQIHPKKSEYVNAVENCLHLWKPKGHEINELISKGEV